MNGNEQQQGSRLRLPSPERVKFWKDLLELALLLLALPWILAHMLRDPNGSVARGPSFG